jgi:hypothetical protein
MRLRLKAKRGMVRYQGVPVAVCRVVRRVWEVVIVDSRRGRREKGRVCWGLRWGLRCWRVGLVGEEVEVEVRVRMAGRSEE